jgi:hypothetical protein
MHRNKKRNSAPQIQAVAIFRTAFSNKTLALFFCVKINFQSTALRYIAKTLYHDIIEKQKGCYAM